MNAAQLFLKEYYPFHYEVGFTVEAHLRDPRLSQHQSVILWIIHSAGADGKSIPRKEIEERLQSWFDVTSSAISKAVRGLSKPPLKLLKIKENPHSARENIVELTPAGSRVIVQMMTRGEQIVQQIVVHMSAKEISQGLHFLRHVSDIVKRIDA